MEQTKKNKIAIIALVFSLIAMSQIPEGVISGINGTNGINGSTVSSVSYIFHNVSNEYTPYASLRMNSTILIDLPKSTLTYTSTPNGEYIIQNWTTQLPVLGLSIIPAGIMQTHFHIEKVGLAHVDRLFYEVGTVNATGYNYSQIGISEYSTEIPDSSGEIEVDILGVMIQTEVNYTDRIVLRLGLNQSGTGLNPTIKVYIDDLTLSALSLPSTPIEIQSLIVRVDSHISNISNPHNVTLTQIGSDTTKVNKTGNEIITGKITISYNGSTDAKILTLVNNASSSSGGGAEVVLASEDYTSLGVGHRLGAFFFGGSYINGSHSIATAAGIASYTVSDWNSTSRPSYFVFQTVPVGSTTRTNALKIDEGQNVSIYGLADTKMTALCIDSNEKIIRSTNATSNYLTC